MRVEAVSLDLKQRDRLYAIVTDDGGTRRGLTYGWMEKEPTGCPPPTWKEALQGECEFQRADEFAAERGAKLP